MSNTNANTTTARAIMNAAHQMTRETITRYPSADYRVTLAAALRIAHAETRTGAEKWRRMSGEEQRDALLRKAGKEYQRDGSRVGKSGNPGYYFQWIDPRNVADGLEAVTHEAWILMTDYVNRAEYAEKSLGWLLTAAVIRAAQSINRAERRNARALKTRADDDGTEAAYIIDHAAPIAEPIAPSPESAALMSDKLDRAAADDIDRAIIAMTGAGYTQSEIAARAGISQTAIYKRLKRIRERYNAD